MACLVAQQPDIGTAGSMGGSPGAAAQTLLAVLKAPVKLEWTVDLGSRATAVLSAELSPEGAVVWPPTKAQLRVANGSNKDFELKLPSAATAEQLEVVLKAALALLNSKEGDSQKTPTSSMDEAASPAAADGQRSLQLPVIEQWHHDVCGHHAMFSTRCLMRGEHSHLLNEEVFWSSTLQDIAALANHGEASGRWPRSRVTCGVADACHLQHLIDSDDTFSGQISVVQSADDLRSQLQDPSSSTKRALDDLLAGRCNAHGFLIGAITHWYAAIAVLPEPETPPSTGGNYRAKLLLCDSYNRPFPQLEKEEDLDAMVEKRMEVWRQWTFARLREDPYWAHRPEESVKLAVEEGVEEWWKGVRKSSLFWRFQPAEVKRQLLRQELGGLAATIAELSEALGLTERK
eukprot:gb/GFBE01031729.1/.p1 GENE.gb/GFBE01031729.1/~~gb/GFBE01031729.1/.p1  ORF type:complete len:403 (+),score=106.81 gb/GFBE01031729.1/:1-1209(+)